MKSVALLTLALVTPIIDMSEEDLFASRGDDGQNLYERNKYEVRQEVERYYRYRQPCRDPLPQGPPPYYYYPYYYCDPQEDPIQE